MEGTYVGCTDGETLGCDGDTEGNKVGRVGLEVGADVGEVGSTVGLIVTVGMQHSVSEGEGHEF